VQSRHDARFHLRERRDSLAPSDELSRRWLPVSCSLPNLNGPAAPHDEFARVTRVPWAASSCARKDATPSPECASEIACSPLPVSELFLTVLDVPLDDRCTRKKETLSISWQQRIARKLGVATA
jgi:hypothetical protein